MSSLLDNELFTRVIDQAFSFEELKVRLSAKEPIRIKYGVDVTAPFLHIGHAVNLWAMRQMQEFGHKVVFLIGDFTTRIGDPTGKSKTRPVIPQEEIEKNAECFIEQVSGILRTDESVFEIRRNSEWYAGMELQDFLGLLSQVTHGRLIARDMFQRRLESDSEIYMHELLYPILQGYDSVMLDSDLTIVGSDQLFNEMMGKFYQEKCGQRSQVILTTRITMGTDGKNKQSKSLNNYIALADTPSDKFGKLMSLPDTEIVDYLEVYTNLPSCSIEEMGRRLASNPMEIKKAMAEAVVERYHGTENAKAAREAFRNIVQRGNAPDQIDELQLPSTATMMDAVLLAMPGKSKTQIRELIDSGAVRLNGEKQIDRDALVFRGEREMELKVGKRNWFKLVMP